MTVILISVIITYRDKPKCLNSLGFTNFYVDLALKMFNSFARLF